MDMKTIIRREDEDRYYLFVFMESVIGLLLSNGRAGTAEKYRSALNSFRTFRGGKDLCLDELDGEVMEAYQAWLLRRGVTPNTVSFYARILRAVYNRAVEQGLTGDRHPFRRVYTGIGKTVKRALPLDVIRQIKDLDLSAVPKMGFARDMFMLSFYFRGMSLVDMAFLKKTSLSNGAITYRRRKTGRVLSIEWTGEMQNILDRYPSTATGYLLPIIKSAGADGRCSYRNMGFNINYNLKKIARMLNLRSTLTMYVARHSWASAARDKGIAMGVICEGMGHDSEATTRIYLAGLDTALVNGANSLILSSLK